LGEKVTTKDLTPYSLLFGSIMKEKHPFLIVLVIILILLVLVLVSVWFEDAQPYFVALSGLSSFVLLIVLYFQTTIMKQQYDLQETLNKQFLPELTLMVKSSMIHMRKDIEKPDLMLKIVLIIHNPTSRKNKIISVSANPEYKYGRTYNTEWIERPFSELTEIDADSFIEKGYDLTLIPFVVNLEGNITDTVNEVKKKVVVTVTDFHNKKYSVSIENVLLSPYFEI
jgi:hypothetical protein